MLGSQHRQQVAYFFHDVTSIRLTSSFKRKIMVCCYRTTLVPVPFIHIAYAESCIWSPPNQGVLAALYRKGE